MKKYLLLLCALALVFTQCKKKPLVEPTTPETPGNGTYLKAIVDFGEKTTMTENDGILVISWATGDNLYVVKEGSCIGTLTYDGSSFTGSVSTDLKEGDCLYLYYLGNITVENGAKSATMEFKDQVSSGLSGIGSFHAGISHKITLTEDNVGGTEAITTTMRTKTSVAKFTFPLASDPTKFYTSTNEITVMGDYVYSTLTVNFSDSTFKGSNTQSGIKIGTGDKSSDDNNIYFALIPSTDKETTLTFNGQSFKFNNGIKANKFYRKLSGKALTVEMPEPGEASTGNTEYSTDDNTTGLQKAVNSVNSSDDVVTLVKDVELSGSVQVSGSESQVEPYTLNLNNNDITVSTSSFTGSAVFIMNGTNDVTIGGDGVVTSGTNYVIGQSSSKGTSDLGTFYITGGTYDKDPDPTHANTNFSDGKVTYELCGTSVNNGDGTWTVTDNRAAKIGDVKYATLAAAVAAVDENATATITMIADDSYETSDDYSILIENKTITLDLAGQTVSCTNNKAGASEFIKVGSGAELIITDSSCGEIGKITYKSTHPDGSYYYESDAIYNCGGTVRLQSGTVENTSNGGASYVICNSSNAWAYGVESYFYMTGGTITGPSCDAALRIYQNNNTTVSHNYVTISGGNIKDTGIFMDVFYYQNLANIITELNIEGGEIHGLIDLKLRHQYEVVNISGGTFVDSKLRVRHGDNSFGGVNPPDHKIFNISGGSFTFENTDDAFSLSSTTTTDWGEYVPYSLTGGTYNADPSAYVASGYKVSGTNPYTVVEASNVAEVTIDQTTTSYESLHEALVAGKTAGSVVKLIDNVNLTGSSWTPVADFNGTFDGNGKTISNLTVSGTSNLGLFANTDTQATIKDLTITGAKISGTGTNVGVLAGSIAGSTISGVTIQNSTISGTAKYAGAITGSGYPSASNCTVTGCTITGKDQVGGLIGYLWVGHIENCTVTSNTVTATEERAGGLIGKIEISSGNLGSSTMWVDGNTISGTATAPDYAGGIAAQIMGDVNYYSIQGNTIDVICKGNVEGDNEYESPIGVLRSGQNAAFVGSLQANVTGNTWTDDTWNSDTYEYDYNLPDQNIQIISRITVAKVTVGTTFTEYSDLYAALVAGKGSGATVELLRNVTLSGEWTPVDDFNGTFDGKGYTISGLTVTGTGNLGLFASTNTSATIQNLTITGATITSTSGSNHGVLAGSISGSTVTNVVIQNSTVEAAAGQYTGGMFGTGYPAASGCTVTGCTIKGYDQVGGLAGYLWVGHIENCTVTNNSVTATSERAGGLVGKVQIAAGNLGASEMWINGNEISATLVQAPDMAGGIAAQIMGDVNYYSIKNNTIDIASFGTTPSGKINPIGNLRDSQNADFTGALAKNITGNDWTDETLNQSTFEYTNVASGVASQVICRGKFYVDANGVYHIGDLSGLKTFRDVVNLHNTNWSGKTFVLENDINLNNETWTPIECEQNKFGTFNGNNHTISNFIVNVDGSNGIRHAGLFGDLGCGTVKNLIIDGANVSGINQVGAIVGYGICAKIEGCTVKNSTVGSYVKNNDDGDKAGAICGYLSAEGTAWVKGCTVNNCTINGYRDCGSVVGYANGAAEVSGNAVNTVTLNNYQLPDYKNYGEGESNYSKYDFNDVVGEKADAATVDDNNVGSVTINHYRQTQPSK